MQESIIRCELPTGVNSDIPCRTVHTLVLGSGAAGLSAALQLHSLGVEDVLIVTEGLQMGTSINTGSDKQTYYKLSLCGAEMDSPRLMAETFYAGGSMHGDLALVEAALSSRAFFNLVGLGVAFPTDRYGQYAGYKTDHDPRRRATSVGPYTSREMCKSLIREVNRRGIPVHEGRKAVALLTVAEAGHRAAGAVVINPAAGADGRKAAFEVYLAENVVFALGGPGGLYAASVYPACHLGGIGLALAAGAEAANLPESQFGMASTKFRWNVSGTYMQVIPRFISTAADGLSDTREFFDTFFASPGERDSLVFLKGYQWPFDARKAAGGSSILDILVYQETVIMGRRVFLDYRANPSGFSYDGLSAEARDYLARSKATTGNPLDRLRTMNPKAIELYREHGIDLAGEPLEIAVCAQHNNGGLSGGIWWESTNIAHLFPIGEVNGSHGIYRPGGAALNAGQVGGMRAAEFIAAKYAGATMDAGAAAESAGQALAELAAWTDRACRADRDWREERDELRARMSRAGAHIRSVTELGEAVTAARRQMERILNAGCRFEGGDELAEALANRQLCLAQLAYLEAIAFAVDAGVGSRGSAVVLDARGQPLHAKLGTDWRFLPEDEAFREFVLQTTVSADLSIRHAWVNRRPLPEPDDWFETVWSAYRDKSIYEKERCSGPAGPCGV